MAETTDALHTLPPAHPGILRSKSTSDVSTASSDSKSPSITFAPLPELAPRKRRNTRPIGLASRAEMLRRTRHQCDASCEGHHERPLEEEDIPLPDIGKLVKGLWRSVSRGHGKDKNARTTQISAATNTEDVTSSANIEEDGDGEGCVWMEEVTWTPLVDTCSPSLLAGPVKREAERDTMSTIDSGSFMDEYDRNKSEAHVDQPRLDEAKEPALK